MHRRLAILYDTANILHNLKRGIISTVHIFYPIVLSYAEVTVGVLPIVRRDLSRVYEEYEEYLHMIHNVCKSFLWDNIETLLGIFDDPAPYRLAISQLGTCNDWRKLIARGRGSQIMHLALVDERCIPRGLITQEEAEELKRKATSLGGCKKADVLNALNDLKIYVAPFADTLIDLKYCAIVVSNDSCFRELAELYLTGKGVVCKGLPASALKDLKCVKEHVSNILKEYA